MTGRVAARYRLQPWSRKPVRVAPISGDMAVEDLVRMVPRAPAVLRARGLVCIQCGEPVWGTLAALAAARGISDLTPIIAALEQARESAAPG